MFGLLVIFGPLWGEPWYGKNASLMEGFTAGPHHGKLTWGSLLPVPWPIATQRPLRAMLNAVDAPQGACRGHDYTPRVRPTEAFPVATLLLAPPLAGVGVTDGTWHRPAGAIGGDDGLGAQGERGRETCRDRRGGWRCPARGGRLWA
jgi:hypothetical protein